MIDKKNETNIGMIKDIKKFFYRKINIQMPKKANNFNNENSWVPNIEQNSIKQMFTSKSKIIKDPINKIYDSSLNNKINYNNNNRTKYIRRKIVLLKKIFPDIMEINKYSNLPFFSINDSNKKDSIKEDFLFRISNRERFFNKNSYSNFMTNKGIKRGFTIEHSKSGIEPKMQLKLDIKNFNTTKNKIHYSSRVMNKLKGCKSEILIKKNNKNKDDSKYKGNIIFNRNTATKINRELNSGEKETFDKTVNTKFFNSNSYSNEFTSPSKKPFKYPINFYSSKQLEIRKKRFNKNISESWKMFKRKINSILDNDYKNNIKLGSCSYKYNQKLFQKYTPNMKSLFLKECRMRDSEISNKLSKCQFNNEDIKKILNGQNKQI